jgi:FG-GAP-like repeat/Beta-propeller repeat
LFRVLLFSLISSATFLAAGPQPQAFRRPLVFEPNRGQAPAEVKWLARGPGYQLFFAREGVTMGVEEGAAEASGSQQPPARGHTSTVKYSMERMKLAGSRPWDDLTGLEPTGGVSNYFVGNNAEAWRTNIPHFNRVSARSVYDGIDVVFYAKGGDLEYDFVVKPGADPKKIQLAFEGQHQMRVDPKSGDLVLTMAGGAEVRQLHPKVYQQIGKQRVEVAGGYELLDRGRAAFALARYDRRRPLVIDPTIAIIKFIGASDGGTYAAGVTVDRDGNSYVTGATFSKHLPLQQPLWHFHECDGGFLGFCSASDAFVTKLSPSGEILFSTYLGGDSPDGGSAIAVDSTGVFTTGYTRSGDFPKTLYANGSFDTRFGGADAFVTKLSPDGSQLIYSRIISGAGNDGGNAIAVDSQHAIWMTGQTTSRTLFVGTSSNRYAAAINGPSDVFYAKYGPAGEFVFRGLSGGSGDENGTGVAIDPDDNPWFTGQTCSPDFPATIGFNNPKGRCSVFVLRLTNQPQEGTTKFAAVFGGSELGDSGTAIAVNATREAYVGGFTRSFLFPVEPGGYQTVPTSTGPQAFVVKLDGFGHFVHTTFLGDNGNTFGYSIAINGADEVYLSGSTTSTSFPGAPAFTPLLNPLTGTPDSGFVSKFSPDLSALLFTTIMGNAAYGVAVSETVPSVTPAQTFAAGYQMVGNEERAFVDKLIEDVPASLSQTSPFAGATQWDSAFGDPDGWGLSPSYGTTLMFADINGDGMADVCGRGQAGMYCELSTGTDFGPLSLSKDVFSDAQGWSLGNYYSSLRFGDVNGDRRPEICGRGMAGIYCALNNGNGTFGFPVQWDTSFSDVNGWGIPQYGNTIMFADINSDGKADVCGRGRDGTWCALSTGTRFGSFFLLPNVFSDAQGWNLLDYYTSLRFADVDGDGKPDICGRGMAGIYCAHNNGNRTFGFPALWDSSSGPNFSDADGWGLPQYGSTIMFREINGDGKADVCGRGRAGIWCELSTGAGFDPAFLAQHNFSDAEGWNQLAYYGSLRFADVNGDHKPDICGRRSLGNYCALAK